MTVRDEETLRADRAHAWDTAAETWLTPDDEELARRRAHYIQHGWKPERKA